MRGASATIAPCSASTSTNVIAAADPSSVPALSPAGLA